MTSEDFQLLAEYNQLMNGKLYTAAAKLSDAARKADRQAFFGSIHGTLNHLLVADIIWLKRFANHPRQWQALAPLQDTASPAALDDIVYEQFADLKTERERIDAMIIAFATELDEAGLKQAFNYQNMKGLQFSSPLHQPLLHFFNHQTHHRGQITTLLNQAGIDVGVTDLLMLIR